jgi:hypothetical protein
MSRSRAAFAIALLGACLVVASRSEAKPPEKKPATEPKPAEPGEATENVQHARAEFITATEHVKNARWSEALAAFERSAELRPHALTTFNIAACERALGRYTRARASLKRALEANEQSSSHELAPSFVKDAQSWLAEIEALLVHAKVQIKPADAAIVVDGSPLVLAANKEYVAGLASSGGQPTVVPNGELTLVIDPGVHVFSLSRAGFVNAVVNKTVTPGSTPTFVLDLQSLPATLRIASNREGAIVAVDDLDVGAAPAEILRPAGVYRVAVRKAGFVPYEAKVRVGPGEQPTIQAALAEEKTPITKKAWFWGLAAVVVAGAAVGTYFITRPDPERPAPSGGGLDWVVTLPGAR